MKYDKDYFLNYNSVIFHFTDDVEDAKLIVNDNFVIILNPKYANQKIDKDFIDNLFEKRLHGEREVVDVINRDLFRYLIHDDVNIFDCKYIYVPFSEQSVSLLENNDYEKVYISHEFDFNKETCDKLVDLFGEKEDVFISLKDELSFLSIKEYKKTIYTLNEMIDKIKKYDLSPLEQIVYAYDLVRERVYQKEDVDEDYEISRGLANVLSGDKIVCVGYVNIFNAMLDELGINATLHTYLSSIPGKAGHARSLVHVKDKKYDVDGYFIFDPTHDSRTLNNGNDYLSSYKYFGNSVRAFRIYDHVFHKDLYDSSFSNNMVNLVYDTFDFFKEFLQKMKYSELSEKNQEFLKEFNWKKLECINNMSKFVSGEEAIKEEFLDFKDGYINGSDRTLMLLLFRSKPLNILRSKVKELDNSIFSNDVKLDAIYRVRKIEYYEDPINHPFDTKMCYDIYDNNTMEKDLCNVHAIMEGLELSYCSIDYDNEDYYFSEVLEKEEEKEKELGLVKFTKTLKLINESRKK